MASVLTPAQIAAYAANAGFSGSALSIATAIALAESSGNPLVVGDSNITPGGSVGLWQINLAAHPEYSAADLLDPQANANAAFQVYQNAGNQFTPWTTFKTGQYSPYLPSVALPAPSSFVSTLDPAAIDGSVTGLSSTVLIAAAVVGVLGLLWWMD
jgi:hypothetical protein